jgi:hypothetical protein
MLRFAINALPPPQRTRAFALNENISGLMKILVERVNHLRPATRLISLIGILALALGFGLAFLNK